MLIISYKNPETNMVLNFIQNDMNDDAQYRNRSPNKTYSFIKAVKVPGFRLVRAAQLAVTLLYLEEQLYSCPEMLKASFRAVRSKTYRSLHKCLKTNNLQIDNIALRSLSKMLVIPDDYDGKRKVIVMEHDEPLPVKANKKV